MLGNSAFSTEYVGITIWATAVANLFSSWMHCFPLFGLIFSSLSQQLYFFWHVARVREANSFNALSIRSLVSILKFTIKYAHDIFNQPWHRQYGAFIAPSFTRY